MGRSREARIDYGRLMAAFSEELNSLAFFALDLAVSSVVPTGSGFVPFVVRETAEGRDTLKFSADSHEKAIAKARVALADEPHPLRAVLAWGGFLSIEGKKFETVFVEASEEGASVGMLVAQRYEKTGVARRKSVTVGNPVLVDDSRDPLF